MAIDADGPASCHAGCGSAVAWALPPTSGIQVRFQALQTSAIFLPVTSKHPRRAAAMEAALAGLDPPLVRPRLHCKHWNLLQQAPVA